MTEELEGAPKSGPAPETQEPLRMVSEVWVNMSDEEQEYVRSLLNRIQTGAKIIKTRLENVLARWAKGERKPTYDSADLSWALGQVDGILDEVK